MPEPKSPPYPPPHDMDTEHGHGRQKYAKVCTDTELRLHRNRELPHNSDAFEIKGTVSPDL